MVLMRTDPFRELDRLTQQVLGTAARPAVMPMDAWRDGDQFIVEFDLPHKHCDISTTRLTQICAYALCRGHRWWTTHRGHRFGGGRAGRPSARPPPGTYDCRQRSKDGLSNDV
jgi:hypothetical protein